MAAVMSPRHQTKPADTLILDLQPPVLGEKQAFSELDHSILL